MSKVNCIEKAATAIVLAAVIYACFVILGVEKDWITGIVRWAL